MIHPSDAIYALERAIKALENQGEQRHVIHDVELILDEIKREAKKNEAR